MPLFPLSLARERGSMGCSGHIFPNDKADGASLAFRISPSSSALSVTLSPVNRSMIFSASLVFATAVLRGIRQASMSV
jgi:hypothetical protein